MPEGAQEFIHRFIPGSEPRRTPLLLLHGTGGDENDLLPLAAHIDRERTILSPRGKVNETGMTRFFRRSPDGIWDLDDFKVRTTELASFIRQACAAYALQKPIALGYSNGANIAWSLLLTEPGLLGGAILLRAGLQHDPRPLPALGGVPVLLIAGHDDDLIPVERAGELAALLGEAGANVVYEVLHAGHGLTHEDVALASEWLAPR